jgi:hypothetical protein
LSWFDERPAWLAELVASLSRVGVAHVVAVDGAYGLFPRAAGASPSEQAQTVVATAEALGMGVTLHVPPHPWVGNEVEKRSFMFRLAHLVAEPEVDWLFVIDGDELVIVDDTFAGALEGADEDVAEVMLTDDCGSYMVRRLFRAQPAGVYVVGNHASYVTGEGVTLWDPRAPSLEAPALQLWDLRLRHRAAARQEGRTAARNEYYAVRRDTGAEVW